MASLPGKVPPWPGRDPHQPDEVMVQFNVRVPFWYREKLQALNPRKTVAANVVDILAKEIPLERPRKTLTELAMEAGYR